MLSGSAQTRKDAALAGSAPALAKPSRTARPILPTVLVPRRRVIYRRSFAQNRLSSGRRGKFNHSTAVALAA